ncbi:L,D-transpeptidase [Aminipila terrae]|uniref:L,D-transpeptidase family protein n=1 Tax=Aminipila terrae TaxID=2697030 RepID=A0A6P1MH18_9FIRM|nr:L,D-transpeptidase [Aminipila terrae]QHI71874.1 L,D-transpeptidase family protein [Aminipila terrae]
MKHLNLLLVALSLLVILVFILIVGPDTEEALVDKDKAAAVKANVSSEIQKNEKSDKSEKYSRVSSALEEKQEETKPLQYGFDLKYTKYLIQAPYTYVVNGQNRRFQFNVMREKIGVAEKAIGKYRLTYIDNYKNQNGKAPKYKGGEVDALGNERSAAAPAYANINKLNEFVYLTDGTLVEVLEEDGEYTLIGVVGTDLEYSVPREYVASDDCLMSLKKVIVVDRTNQNIATFEKKEGNWNITSYSMATTGKVGKYHQPTPLGYYYAIEKKPKFFYVKDGTNDIQGYAPYAVRFNAGAYIHGVSTTYKHAADGTRIDPGINEFSNSIGTVPLSHKCVRNYTSHAKFIYDWYEHGKTIVIVIE